jgi:hypothetical protein
MRYRYMLERGENPRALVFIMVNPSIATGDKHDPTIRKCKGFARTLGFDGFKVVNLFASIATDPKSLRYMSNPEGPLNDYFIADAISAAEVVIVAWGSLGKLPKDLRQQAGRMIRHAKIVGKNLYCLGQTTSGDPRHPLMTPYATPLTKWPG